MLVPRVPIHTIMRPVLIIPTGELKNGSAGRLPTQRSCSIYAGYSAGRNYHVSYASAESTLRARKRNAKIASSYPAYPDRLGQCWPGCEPIGMSRTSCIGSWILPFGKMTAACARILDLKISLFCDILPSISSNKSRLQNEASRENAFVQPGTRIISNWSSRGCSTSPRLSRQKMRLPYPYELAYSKSTLSPRPQRKEKGLSMFTSVEKPHRAGCAPAQGIPHRKN